MGGHNAPMDAAEAALLAFGVALPAVGLAARWAPRLGLLDAPAAHKSHARPVPRSGGLGLALGLGVGALAAIAPGDGAATGRAWGLPALGFFALGWADDRFRLRARTKLVGQVLLAASAVGLGLSWGGGGWGAFPALAFGAATPWMTGLWIVAVVTLVNFLDGIDLLTVAWTAVPLAVAAGAGAGPDGGACFAAALGALLGFAAWNVTPARAFVGDAGTHLLGFLVAASALEGPGPHVAALPWPVVGGLLLPAVVDVAAGLVAKARRGVPLSAAHRDHPYQRLTRRGLPHAAVALRYGALTLLAAWTAARGSSPLLALGGAALGVLVLGGNLLEASRAPRAPASAFSYNGGRSAPESPP